MRPKRVPFVAQIEGAECGAACLTMILHHYGRIEPLPRVREASFVGRDGASALSLVEGATTFGLKTDAYKIEAADIADLPTPAILHWERHHFVVLEGCNAEGLFLADPAKGKRFVAHAAAAVAFSGTALHPHPAPEFRKGKTPRKALATLWPLVRTAARSIVPLLVVVALSELVGFLFPTALPFLFDHVLPASRLPWLLSLVIALVLISIVLAILGVARGRVLNGLRARLEVSLASTLVGRMLALERAFFLRRGSASFSVTVAQLLELRDTIANAMLASFDLVLLVGYAVLMFAYNVRLSLVAVVMLVVRLSVSSLLRGPVEELATAAIAARDRVQAAVGGILAGPELIKALRIEDLVESTIEGLRTREINARQATAAKAHWAREIGPLLNATSLALLFIVGGHEVMKGRATVGVLYSFLAVELLVRRALASVVEAARDLSDLGPVLDRLEDIELAPRERTTGEFRVLQGGIAVSKVKLRLSPKAPLVLKGVSLDVAKGEHVCIVGPSGSGKSTLLRVIAGLIPPLEGSVTYDGHRSESIELGALRSQIALVSTERAFFDGTIRENLVLGRNVPETRLQEALRTARLEGVITDLEVPLGATASRLSGGQQHRLLLARALLGYPRVLLLDELTSSFDAKLEADVLGSLRDLGLTIVSVAHRQSALRTADRIVIMESGEIRAVGTFEELAQSSLLFRRLAKLERVA